MTIILSYILCIIIIYYTLNRQFHYDLINNKKIKIYNESWISICIITILIASINYLYTYNQNIELSYDRTFYQIGYNNDESPSMGLLIIFLISRNLNLDFNQLALLITILSVPLVFIAYKISKGKSPIMIVLLLLTPYIINGFDNFKQTFTNGFACLLFALFSRNNSLRNSILEIFLVILACVFHPTGFILIIFYILHKFNIHTKNTLVIVLVLFISTLFLKPILLSIANVVSGYIPFLSDKIYQYFDEDSLQREGRIIVAFKGIVYLFITLQILFHKDCLRKSVKNFDFYLMTCLFVCFLYILSYYNVWMPRMTELFIFPIMLFWTKCLHFIPKHRTNIIITGILSGFFTFRLLWMTVV